MDKTNHTKWIVILLGLCLLGGCTTVPTEQFEAYKRAFDDVRASGEEVLLDYGVAKSDYKRRKQEAENGDGQLNAPNRMSFDINAITETGSPPDDVVERMYAWNVLAQYNETLSAVARGNSRQEISATVDGLTETLRKFPIKEISEAGAGLAPCASVVTAALEIMEREIAARRFNESIQAVYPAINEFLCLLERDAQSFYNIRLGLRNLDHGLIEDQIVENTAAFQALLGSLNIPAPPGEDEAGEDEAGEDEAADRIHPVIKQVNDTLAGIPDWPSDGMLVLSQSGNGEYTELAHSQFVEMASEIERLAGEAKAVDDELIAFRDVLIQYVKLTTQMRRALKELVNAIKGNRQPEAVAQNMFEAAIKLKRAISEYKKAR